MELKIVVAANIRKLRLQKGMTQSELAHRIRGNVRFISQLEMNPQNVTLQTIQRVAEALEVEPYQLLFDFSHVIAEQASQLEELGLLAAKRVIEDLLSKRRTL